MSAKKEEATCRCANYHKNKEKVGGGRCGNMVFAVAHDSGVLKQATGESRLAVFVIRVWLILAYGYKTNR